MSVTINVLSLGCDPGFYASATLESCVKCPSNSNSTKSGLPECPCDEGYYRTPQEVDLPCTSEYIVIFIVEGIFLYMQLSILILL